MISGEQISLGKSVQGNTVYIPVTPALLGTSYTGGPGETPITREICLGAHILRTYHCRMLAKGSYVILFDLKPLIKGSKPSGIYGTVCMHKKRAPGTSRTHFRACKISNFPGGVPPRPPQTIYIAGPHFKLYLQFRHGLPILSMVPVLRYMIGLHCNGAVRHVFSVV